MPGKRKRLSYAVEIHDHGCGEMTYYGPYTEAQAEKVAAKMERFFAKQAKEDEEDSVNETVVIVDLLRWKQPEMPPSPRKPLCPFCKVKMGVWTSDYGEQESYASCNNSDCDSYTCEIRVEEKDGKWVFITNPEESVDD